MLAAAYAPELQALKQELQATLARMGGDSPSWSSAPRSPLSDAASAPRVATSEAVALPDVVSVGETATTTTSSPHRQAATPEQGFRRRQRHAQRRDRPATAWNRRYLMRELAAASARRRELEIQLQQEMQRDQEQQRRAWQHQSDELTAERRHRRHRRRSAMQEAITALQHQRAEILQQIRLETAADLAASPSVNQEPQHAEEAAEPDLCPMDSAGADVEPSVGDAAVLEPPSSNTTLENQYSIGGVVTLEPLPRLPQHDSAALSHRPPGGIAASATASELHSLLAFRKPPDALNDVFSLQLKFAETMLKLEKSVQVRDQLLRHGASSAVAKRSRLRRRVDQRAYQHGAPAAAAESGSSSDSSVMRRDNWSNSSSASLSSSAFSLSSVESTPRPRRRLRTGAPYGSRTTGMEMATPYSVSNGNSPGSGDTTVSPGEGSSNSPPELQSHTSHSFGEPMADKTPSSSESPAPHDPMGQRSEAASGTPVDNSSTTTPTTGSDQKSTGSSSKQVRFGQDDAYSTPVIARRFNFDNPSIDEDDDEDEDEVEGVGQGELERKLAMELELEQEEVESMLSFLDGSSVSSAELNDASFLRAFERFRREVNPSRRFSSPCFASADTNTAANALFKIPDAGSTSTEQVNTAAGGSAPCTPVKKPRVSLGDGAATADVAAASQDPEETSRLQGHDDGGDLSELQERRRQLCLDIQAESAELVLRFGAAQDADAGARDAESTKTRLLALRQELEALDERLAGLQHSSKVDM